VAKQHTHEASPHPNIYPVVGLIGTILAIALFLPTPLAAAETTDCVGIVIQTAEPGGGPSTLSRVDLPDGASTKIRTLGYEINAIGYASGQNRIYGIADHDPDPERWCGYRRQGVVPVPRVRSGRARRLAVQASTMSAPPIAKTNHATVLVEPVVDGAAADGSGRS